MSPVAAWREFTSSVRADHRVTRSIRERYPTDGPSMQPKGFFVAAVTNVGLQMLIAVRFMRLLRNLGVPGGPQVVSRLIRHLYSAEIHWNAEIAPGVSIVHGTGLVISHGSVVGPNCMLFQNVTLGESMHSSRRTVGSPTLLADVHVMPGAVLLGPITVGESSKIGANAVVDTDLEARSVVRSPASDVTHRSNDGAQR